MAGPEEFGARDRPHISIGAIGKVASYRFPPRELTRMPLRDNYAAHASSLLAQLSVALGDVPARKVDSRATVKGLKLGTVVEIETLAPAKESRSKVAKVPTTLEFPTQDIVVLRSIRNENRTESALVFVPDDARTFLRSRIAEYGRDMAPGPRPDLERFEKVEAVRSATVDALFVVDVQADGAEVVWWEIWTRSQAVSAEIVAELARLANLDVHADRLIFPDTTVLFVHASIEELKAFVSRVPGAITEVRRSTETIELYLERGNLIGQQDWVIDLVSRVQAPVMGVPVVCILDTGVNAAHPLLAAPIHGNWAFDNAWGTHDHAPHGGHGTALASLVLYGDLGPAMRETRRIVLNHAVESMKLLPPSGFPKTKPPSYGFVTQGAVASAEIERPNIRRSFCLATSAADFPASRPSSWSGALDQIASGSMPGDLANNSEQRLPKRLLLVATGNVQGGMLPNVNELQAIEDPSQSWNSLTIGGFTTKDQAPAYPPRLTAVVRANHRSPFSRGSQSLPEDLTPIKPEVLFEAGNMVADELGLCDWHPAVSLLAAGSDVVTEPLVPMWATSAAVGMAGNFIGRMQAEFPELWPETLRALTVNAAVWPQPIRKMLIGRGAHWRSHAKNKMQQILREVGFGVPDIDRAIRSARNDVTLIAQAELQPFDYGADGRSAVFHQMHFYDLPWPKSALEKLENAIVEMKVTLSYFIEPNLSGKAATRPETYRSFGLRFEMKKRNETDAHFRSRLTASQEESASESATETSCWLLGPKSVNAGSLHCDLWRGRAIDLAAHDAIAIYPVSGWWKSHLGQRQVLKKARYSLVISISAAGEAIDLHAEVTSLVEVRGIQVSVS